MLLYLFWIFFNIIIKSKDLEKVGFIKYFGF